MLDGVIYVEVVEKDAAASQKVTVNNDLFDFEDV